MGKMGEIVIGRPQVEDLEEVFTVQEMGGIAKFQHMKRNFIRKFVAMRKQLGYKTQILSTYRPGDEGSHGEGLALDFIWWEIWKETPVDWLLGWKLLTTYPFTGFGIYFDWHVDGKPTIGYHVDDSPIANEPRKRPLFWIRLNGEYYYSTRPFEGFYNNKNHREISLSFAFTQFLNQSEADV